MPSEEKVFFTEEEKIVTKKTVKLPTFLRFLRCSDTFLFKTSAEQ
jgi:hypothetical protein